jgi:hypothetical protein
MKDEYYVCIRSENRYEANQLESILKKELKEKGVTVRLM